MMQSSSAIQHKAPAPSAAPLAEAHLARVAADATAHHAHMLALLSAAGASGARDLADAIHLLCHLHGRHPGVIDMALAGGKPGPERAWLETAAARFAEERNYLVRLVSAVGPLPSTPGAAETETALLSQRHAIETLAASERAGCALGAASALCIDWIGIRWMLDRVAQRVGVEAPPSLPSHSDSAAIAEACADSLAAQRALRFGAEQLLLQHRALFDLLEARAAARHAAEF